MSNLYNGQPVNISFFSENEAPMDAKTVQLSEAAIKDPTTWLRNGIYCLGTGQPIATSDGKFFVYIGRRGNATDIADDTKWVKFATEADFEEFLSHADLGNVVRAASMAQKTNYIPKFTSADGTEIGASGITENDLNDVLKEMQGSQKAATPSNPIVGTHGYMIKLFRERGNTFGSDYVLPSATDNALGGIKTGFTAEIGVKQYPVLLDANGKAYVAVPWTDTQAGNATESAAGLITAAEKKYLNVVTAEIATAAENTFIADIVALIPKVGSRAFVVSLNMNNNFFGINTSVSHVLGIVDIVSASAFVVHFANYSIDGASSGANVVYHYDSATKKLYYQEFTESIIS